MIMSRTRVVVADDDLLLREGIARLLKGSQFELSGLAGDASELMQLVRRDAPDLVVLDIRMPPSYSTEGLEAAHAIRCQFPQIGILLLSAHAEVKRAVDLLAEGERVGYLLKTRVTNATAFREDLQRVADGGSVIDPTLVKELVSSGKVDDPLGTLTAREREVLGHMAEGRSNAGIARVLWVTEGTVKKHVRSILAKLPLPETDNDHRRVLAVITFLEAR
jgi:DNA-binding NarL/FixJ family response regulator